MTVHLAMVMLYISSFKLIEGQNSHASSMEKGIQPYRTPEEIFKQNFIQRRVEQLTAIKQLQITENSVDQYKMISIMAQKLFGVVQDTKEVLDEIGFFHGSTKLPKDVREQEVLIHFMENTALLCDFLVFLPDAFKRLLMFNFRWRILLIDSIEFASSIKFLDENTLKQFHQASAILAEPPQENNNYSVHIESRSHKKKEDRKKPKRGPRLSSVGSSGGEL